MIDDAEIAVPTVPVLGLTPSDSEVVAVPTVISWLEVGAQGLAAAALFVSPL